MAGQVGTAALASQACFCVFSRDRTSFGTLIGGSSSSVSIRNSHRRLTDTLASTSAGAFATAHGGHTHYGQQAMAAFGAAHATRTNDQNGHEREREAKHVEVGERREDDFGCQRLVEGVDGEGRHRHEDRRGDEEKVDVRASDPPEPARRRDALGMGDWGSGTGDQAGIGDRGSGIGKVVQGRCGGVGVRATKGKVWRLGVRATYRQYACDLSTSISLRRTSLIASLKLFSHA